MPNGNNGSSSGSGSGKKSNPMTKADSMRIQSTQSKNPGGQGFSSRAQSAGDKHQYNQSKKN